MKQLYLVIALLFISISFGQDPKGNVGGGDIPGFKIYPNPVTNGRVYISTSLNAPKQIFIYDIFGSQVLETTIIGSELNVRIHIQKTLLYNIYYYFLIYFPTFTVLIPNQY